MTHYKRHARAENIPGIHLSLCFCFSHFVTLGFVAGFRLITLIHLLMNMRTRFILSIAGVLSLAVAAPSVCTAQALTVTIGTIPASSFCSGDPISVSFTATGYWQHKNAFTLQLSDASGSFTSGFTNLASIKDTLPGSFTITSSIPTNLANSAHYRFRIMAALPYMTSADNGSDIAIGQVPQPRIFIGDSNIGVGHALGVYAYGTVGDTNIWDFGGGVRSGGTGDSVVYSTGGLKTITLRTVSAGGCSATDTATVRVFDCTPPAIPHDAIVINNDTTIYGWYLKSFWVNPGVNVTFLNGNNNTIFAESGSTINCGQSGNIYYLKQGALLNSYGYYGGMVVFATGASVGNPMNSLECPSLNFDYTNAPPNAAMPAGVTAPVAPMEITLSPNPTRGIVSITGLPSNARDISLENVLGASIASWNNSGSHDLTLDLSKDAPGTYYFRFISGATVVTKKVVLQ